MVIRYWKLILCSLLTRVIFRFSQPGTWEAYLGLHAQQNVGRNVAKRNLKQVISHPNYNPFTYDNDIALMELDSPVTYSDYIQPICLPAAQHDFPAGNTVWITGWGATREGGELSLMNTCSLISVILQIFFLIGSQLYADF